jgi:hypothetical protein
MVMWNVVGQSVRLGANALGRFAASDAGKKTGEALASSARSVRDATKAAKTRFDEERAQHTSPSRDDGPISAGDRVRVSNGATGRVLRYLNNNELPLASPNDRGVSKVVVVEADAPTSPMDRHLIVAAASCSRLR